MGIIQNHKDKKAIKALENLAECGDNQARYELAMILIDGDITKKNLPLAKNYLQQASKEGHLQSKIFLKSQNIFGKINSLSDALSDMTKNINFKV